MYPGDENTFYAAASTRRAANYTNMFKNVNQWRVWLATKGPILAALSADETWMDASATNGKLDTFKPNTVVGGHAICVCGYTADGRFIIRNSWGTSWGDRGFAYASAEYIESAFFNESYGVTL
jgi:aminopeptidase C